MGHLPRDDNIQATVFFLLFQELLVRSILDALYSGYSFGPACER